MPSENIIQRSFAKGEVSPFVYARADLSIYQTGLRTLRNHIVQRYGGATQRPPTMYVGTALNNGNPVRLISFIYNETGLGQSFVLEFGQGYIAFYQNGAVVINGSVPYKIPSPYLQADLQNLQFIQCADIVTITNQNYPIYELKRLGPISWILTDVSASFGSPIAGPSSYTITGSSMSGNNVGYIVTSVNALGEETDNPNVGVGINLKQASVSDPITISWGAIPGASSYNVYTTLQGGSVYGFIGSTAVTTFTDSGFTPDFTQRWPISYNPFVGAGNYPATVGIIQQRRYFANTSNNPIGFWGSYPGDFYNFNYHLTGEDSDAIIASMSGDEVNAIQHLLELKYMLMFTAGAEVFVQGNGSGIVTPSAINASVQSQYGCAALRVLKVGEVVLFNQALGSFIRDFVFDFVIDGYRGNDITIYSAHLFEGYQIVDWAYQKVPDSIIWAVRSDGVLLSCTYVREQQMLAWARHDFNGGFVESVVAIPENGEYAVYLSVRRTLITAAVSQYQIVTGFNDAIDIQLSFGPLYSAFIPPGTYNATTLAVAIVAALNGLELNAGVRTVNWVCSFATGFCDIGQNTGPLYVAEDYKFLWASGFNSSRNAAITLGWPKVDTALSFNPGPNTYDQIAPNPPSSGQVIPGNEVVRYIERLSSRIWQGPATAVAIGTANALGDPIDAPGSDCYAMYDGRNTNSGFGMLINPPAGGFNNTDTAYQELLLVQSQINYFGSGYTAQIGDEIVMFDEEWVSSMGVYGNRVRMTVQQVINPVQAYCTPDAIVPAIFQTGQFTVLWSRGVKIVSGLQYLAGQQVSVWADRFVVGSPLNHTIDTVYTVSPAGILTLDKPYSVIYVGLPMIADFETLQFDTSFGDSIIGERKSVSRLTVYLYNSRGFFGGTQNPDYDPDNIVNGIVQDPLFNLIENKAQGNRQTYNAPPSLMTDWQSTNIPVNWDKEGRIFIRNVDPIPLSILAVVPAGLTSAKVAWSQRP